ncbi:MAG: hypothetical protein HRU17_12160 [Polyangiaceae bacterium]|nr:hypothetical protein [Polyangiaceae bacterium]
MTEEHLKALLANAGAKDVDGWKTPTEGRHITLYVASGAAGLTVSRISALRSNAELLEVRTKTGELFVLTQADVYAGAVGASESSSSSRKAGFV